ncbi:hypothetical protein R1flu_016562 [Riccia fluitans]|uniref:Uncharacterized protein n=1 Tax=Riccia fluitans TaxID=41844 RepID=A0ABD1YM74_9MARC
MGTDTVVLCCQANQSTKSAPFYHRGISLIKINALSLFKAPCNPLGFVCGSLTVTPFLDFEDPFRTDWFGSWSDGDRSSNQESSLSSIARVAIAASNSSLNCSALLTLSVHQCRPEILLELSTGLLQTAVCCTN